MVSYSGPLLAKRKDELADIAKALKIRLPEGTLRPEIIEAVRTELKTNPQARQDPRFIGLWHSMRDSRKSGEFTPDPHENAIEDGDSETDEDEDEDDAALQAEEQPLVEQVQEQVGEVVTSYRDALLHNKIVDTLLHGQQASDVSAAAASVVEEASEALSSALVPASQALRRTTRSGSFSQLARRGSVSLRHAARETATLVEDVQDKASQTWVIVGLILAAELAWLVYESVPWVEHHFGPHDWLHRAQTPGFTLRVPAVTVLLHPSFLRAVIAWALTTYLVPLVIATLVSFPNSSTSTQHHPSTPRGRRIAAAANKRASANKHLSPPNAVIFTLSRLAIALLRGYILTGPARHSAAATASTALRNLGQILLDARIGAHPAAATVAKWSFDSAVQGVWGVVAVGMGLGAVIGIYAELRR
ncbi:hypothetical protein JCM10908_007328 [Rhodotorula pacifica]|uniref:uncharacterized protein n=1 Tax=Rhodotorula pacifica TaxID=1495444 RepID=UPI003174D3C2